MPVNKPTKPIRGVEELSETITTAMTAIMPVLAATLLTAALPCKTQKEWMEVFNAVAQFGAEVPEATAPNVGVDFGPLSDGEAVPTMPVGGNPWAFRGHRQRIPKHKHPLPVLVA